MALGRRKFLAIRKLIQHGSECTQFVEREADEEKKKRKDAVHPVIHIDIWSVSMILQKMLIRLTCIAPIHTRISRARWRQKEKASYWFRLRNSKMSLTVFSCMSLNATKLANHISGANIQLSQECVPYIRYIVWMRCTVQCIDQKWWQWRKL